MADLPVISFIQARLAESDADLETRKGSAFYDLFIKPQELMLQPLLTSMELTLTAQSVRRILALSDPDGFDEALVDDLAANVYVTRDVGSLATATVRVYYDRPVSREYPQFAAEFSKSGLSYFNVSDFVISEAEMALQQEGNLYYFDVAVQAQEEGDDYNADIGEITTFVNDVEAISASNITKAEGGLPKETNTQLLTRARNSIGVRDLETVKGINAILREKFPPIREIQSIGMGDPEMMRDILYNTHVGGHTDVYIKMPTVQVKSTTVNGLTFDYDREMSVNLHTQLTATSFDDENSYVGNPFIVSGSVGVKSDTIETAASILSKSIPASTGINLTGAEWIKLTLNGGAPKEIKVSGATPATTQRFEIINQVNAAVGVRIAEPYGVDQIKFISNIAGSASSLEFDHPTPPKTSAVGVLFLPASPPAPPFPVTSNGEGATIYEETIDYSVDYENGKIINLGNDILSGTIVSDNVTHGDGIIITGVAEFSSPTVDAFVNVAVGDILSITLSSGVPLGDYVVKRKINDYTLEILDFAPTSDDAAVEYHITSSQVVVIDYRYNPLSVDIGDQVILSDGVSRGIRPGRENYTITDTAFLAIESIEEVDADTGEGLGVFLSSSDGYGYGGYGEGGYGTDSGGDFTVVVNSPTERFSAFEDSVITFAPELFGKSYKISYYCVPEIKVIHDVCRDDLERVMGADVLPKSFVPGFVDIDVVIRRDVTNIETPSNEDLAELVKDLIDGTIAGTGLQSSDISKLLEEQGVESVKIPFTMYVEVHNTDGSTSMYSDQDVLMLPSVTLAKDTDNFTTPRITHFMARNVTVTEE
jgi:hypothetical protein